MTDRDALYAWYGPRRSAYPWRGHPSPYAVLVSEIMLQQTQASRVVPAFRSFLARFPTAAALAQASRADVLRAWAGLGYNRRAVALHRAARIIVREHQGRIPRHQKDLVRLPGAGSYTAAAVACFAFGTAVATLDTNVRRVVARVRLGSAPEDLPLGRVAAAAAAWLDPDDPGSWNQALMDLGREVCRPIAPRCAACPLAPTCRFRRQGHIPRRSTARRPPSFAGSPRQLRGHLVRVIRERGAVTLGALAGITERPLTEVSAAVEALASEGILSAGPAARAGRISGRVRLAH